MKICLACLYIFSMLMDSPTIFNFPLEVEATGHQIKHFISPHFIEKTGICPGFNLSGNIWVGTSFLNTLQWQSYKLYLVA